MSATQMLFSMSPCIRESLQEKGSWSNFECVAPVCFLHLAKLEFASLQEFPKELRRGSDQLHVSIQLAFADAALSIPARPQLGVFKSMR
jgi:hypothetical protein